MALRLTRQLLRSSLLSSSRACSSITTSKLPQLPSTNQPRHDRLFERIDVEVRAHQNDVLKSYSWFATTAAKELKVEVLESWSEPEPHKVRKTLLRSAFVNKKHRVQYEFRTYYHMMKFGKLTESTALTFLEYIQRNLPEGVAMKVTKHERKKLPEIINDHILEVSRPVQQ